MEGALRSNHIWRFPRIGGTPKSSISMGFSLINHPQMRSQSDPPRGMFGFAAALGTKPDGAGPNIPWPRPDAMAKGEGIGEVLRSADGFRNFVV